VGSLKKSVENTIPAKQNGSAQREPTAAKAASPAGAEAGGETITPAEAKILVQIAKTKEEPDVRAKWFPGVNTETGEVRVTNGDRKTMADWQKFLYQEDDHGTGIYKSWQRLVTWCGAKPKLIIDMAVIKSAPVDGQVNILGIFDDEIGGGCKSSLAPGFKEFVQKLKAIHIKLAYFDCPKESSIGAQTPQFEYQKSSGELVVKYCYGGCYTQGNAMDKWWSQQ
jgi:hypothetical protein